MEFTVLDILLWLGGAPQVIVGVSLCHKILEGALLFLRLIVVHVTMVAGRLLLVMHLRNWHFFARAGISMTSISFL